MLRTVPCCLFLLSSLAAQVFHAERHRLLPSEPIYQATAGDLDGDGDVDLVANTALGLRILWNDGQGRFTPGPVLAPSTLVATRVALADIDNDGDLDIAIGYLWFFVYAPGQLLRNDGPLGFTPVSTQWPTVNTAPHELLFVDFDGDGDLDLVTADGLNAAPSMSQPAPYNRLYLNNGAGTFTDVTATRMPNVPIGSRSVAAGDIDGDGDVDIVFAAATCRVFVQNAAGVAVETPGRVPNVLASWNTFYDIELVDVDLDGDLDLVGASDVSAVVFHNDGTGVFTLAAWLADPDVLSLHVADIDGDGRRDLLATRGWDVLIQALPLRLWRNTATGFVDATAARLEAAQIAPRWICVFDADGDGDPDVFGHALPQPVLWHNDGQGRLLQVATRDLGNRSIVFAVAADHDGDGDVDVACIDRLDANRVQVFVAHNDGEGPGSTFDVLVPPTSGLQPQCLAWNDVDLDGDLDLFVGMYATGGGTSSHDRLFHNVGGTFVDATATHYPALTFSKGVVLGDITGDGIVDLLSWGWQLELLRGNGTGGFVAASAVLPASIVDLAGAALLDFDQDGDLDVFVTAANGLGGSDLRVLRNDWPSPFVDVTTSLGLPAMRPLALASLDVDGDGRDDLLVGNSLFGTNGIRLFRSVGAGFVEATVPRLPPALAPMVQLAVVDIDGDGRRDLIGRPQSSGGPTELRHMGTAMAIMPNGFVPGHYLPFHPAAADFDGDGDQDVITTFGLIENSRRDLRSVVPPRVGMQAQLVLRAHGGFGSTAQLVSLLIAPAAAAVPIAFGSAGFLRLDPASVEFHSLHTIPATGGEVVVNYAVPAVPAMLGARVFAQGLFVHQPPTSTWRFGNRIELVVRL
jgi:hypothetical protein